MSDVAVIEPCTDVAKFLRREIEAAKLLRDQLVAVASEDETLIRDCIEGETDLYETVRAVIASMGESEALAASLDAYIDTLTVRKRRIAERVEGYRALLITALDVSGRKKIETDVGTVSLSKVQPKVIVTDEAVIPVAFWKAADPKLDRKALAEALKSGQQIPGAELSNGGQTVTIRRS